VASSRAEEPPARSGISLPLGVNRAKGWFRETRSRHRLFRVGVFLVGVVLVVGGATMWLVSSVLSLPAVFLGLWVWSREFHWGHRLFRAFLRRAESMWSRMRVHPVRWTILTVGGVGAAWAAYWAWGHYVLPGMG
jgi:hypothetical protein